VERISVVAVSPNWLKCPMSNSRPRVSGTATFNKNEDRSGNMVAFQKPGELLHRLLKSRVVRPFDLNF
jgi:hypothetical protein